MPASLIHNDHYDLNKKQSPGMLIIVQLYNLLIFMIPIIPHFFLDFINFLLCVTMGILQLDAVDAVDAVDALYPHLLKLDAVHLVPTKTGCSASSIY
jgi:hypothetical protein